MAKKKKNKTIETNANPSESERETEHSPKRRLSPAVAVARLYKAMFSDYKNAGWFENDMPRRVKLPSLTLQEQRQRETFRTCEKCKRQKWFRWCERCDLCNNCCGCDEKNISELDPMYVNTLTLRSNYL